MSFQTSPFKVTKPLIDRFYHKKFASIIVAVAVFLFLGWISGSFVGFNLIQTLVDFPTGTVWFLEHFTPDADSLQYLDRILPALWLTVLDSIAASTTAAVFAYICAVLGSRSVGLGGVVQFIVRAIASIFRNIPIVAWVFLLLFSFKQSEFTGYLALFLQSFGFLTRCFLESIDEMPQGAIEALRASGASYLQVVFRGVIPQSLTSVVSWVLYMIETNIRDATLVGMLTGTGIGFVFDVYYKSFRYEASGLVLLCVVIVVIACETASNYIRRRIDAPDDSKKKNTLSVRRSNGKLRCRVTSKSDKLIRGLLIALVLVTIYTFCLMDYGSVNLGTAFIDAVEDFWTMVTTPGVDGHFTVSDLVYELFVTLALAILTTLGGAIIALFLGLIAASNLSNGIVSNIVKIFMSILRAVPTILWVLVFTVAIGLGAEAAVVGMLFHSVAYLVKAYSESFEEVDKGVLEALRATGASWLQVVCCGVLPEKVNEVVSWTFIRFEINFVAAVVVAGMAGSGGIGYSLFLAGNFYFDIHEIGLIVYMCMAVSIILEVSATKLRKHFIVNR